MRRLLGCATGGGPGYVVDVLKRSSTNFRDKKTTSAGVCYIAYRVSVVLHHSGKMSLTLDHCQYRVSNLHILPQIVQFMPSSLNDPSLYGSLSVL